LSTSRSLPKFNRL